MSFEKKKQTKLQFGPSWLRGEYTKEGPQIDVDQYESILRNYAETTEEVGIPPPLEFLRAGIEHFDVLSEEARDFIVELKSRYYGDEQVTLKDGLEDPAITAQDPYILASGLRISLPQLPMIVESTVGTDPMQQAPNTLRFLVVFGTGRSPRSSGQVGLVSDCLYLPELLSCLHKIAVLSKCNIESASTLDIDLKADLENVANSRLSQANLLLVATGDVNCIAGHVFEFYEDQGTPLRPGCTPPFSPNVVGLCKGYMPYAGVGILVACANPWNHQLVCLIAGGVHAAGTTGALFMLKEYLEFRGLHLGNNNIDKTIPSKVFEVARKSYEVELRDVEDLNPREDIRSIIEDLSKWKIYE